MLKFYVLYKQPSDYPDYFVIREWLIAGLTGSPTKAVELFDNVAAAFAYMGRNHPNLVYIPRHYSDDKVIIGTWI